MPLYEVETPSGKLNGSTKVEIANEITSIHRRFTGAPEAFVNVVFREYGDGDCFVARKPASRSFLLGRIRHGRPLEVRQGMLCELKDMWVRITGQSEVDLLVSLSEVDPAMALEAGFFMPEPGQEKEWFEEHRDRLAQLGVTG